MCKTANWSTANLDLLAQELKSSVRNFDATVGHKGVSALVPPSRLNRHA